MKKVLMGVLSLGLLLGAAQVVQAIKKKPLVKQKHLLKKQKQHLVPLLMVIQIQVN